ncbi:dimethylsulfonioproprionate lyase family protein [Alteromonas sp. C1M14]|uniref:dimethylsulfonioproprionate lyase family protein n=1 Tax=Alteromonas sp. C1M14 TaxID=2841567 RepID=UPI001C08A9FF|nr:dimethylsulfonioproprionate lyase family protein [Alteromonas sp. C1M14]MBU2979639.1 hypothetical protein [Alteromonas sp. C1M14]
MKLQLVAASLCLHIMSLSAHGVEFVCEDNINEKDQVSQAHKVLWQQTLQYLKGVQEVLTKNQGCEVGPRAIIETNNGAGGVAKDCVVGYQDVQKVIKHIDLVLANPAQAKACFDTQKEYAEFPLYTPSAAMKAVSKSAAWIDRPTLTDFFKTKAGTIKSAGQELASTFWDILLQSQMPDYLAQDITAKALPDLWASVGWLPFYADNERALNERFRGGYAYAEVMGPWGLLRIKEIDGETVGAELGMTIQLRNTFYPYHYHHPQEFYMPLSTASCGQENTFFVAHADSALFTSAGDDSVTVAADEHKDVPAWFVPQSPNGNNFTYFERNAIHAFNVSEGCPSLPSGLVSLWGRTTSQDNNQSTQLCTLVANAGTDRHAMPASHYRCSPTQWQY